MVPKAESSPTEATTTTEPLPTTKATTEVTTEPPLKATTKAEPPPTTKATTAEATTTT